MRLEQRNGNLGKSTTIPIVASVGAVAVLTLIVLVFCRRRRKSSTAFPPVQPLAHHREQRLESGLQATNYLSPPTSNLSLPSRKHSFATETSEDVLPLPNGQSSSSLAHGSSDADPLPVALHSRTSRRVTRPKSMSSIASRRSSRSHIRGTPHGPHSQIEIVLPTPLASQYSVNYLPENIADSWTPLPTFIQSSDTPAHHPPVPPIDSRFVRNGTSTPPVSINNHETSHPDDIASSRQRS